MEIDQDRDGRGDWLVGVTAPSSSEWSSQGVKVWNDSNDLDPALFDLNDHFIHEQASAADSGLEYYYPIKQIAEMDNACRMPVGFQPAGDEPGLCPALAPPKPGEPGSPGCQPPAQGCGQNAYWSDALCGCTTFK